jgi:hypothetical protein
MNLYHVKTTTLFPGFDWVVYAPSEEAALTEARVDLWNNWHALLEVTKLRTPLENNEAQILLFLEGS